MAKGTTYPVEILTRNEINLLLKQCSKRAVTGIRNRALIVLLWRSGLRISEALALHAKDIDFEKGTIRVLRGKGGKSRTVGLDELASDPITTWMAVRKEKKIPNKSPLFCTLAGDAMQSRYVRELFARLGRKARIQKRVHPHGLRHTLASELRTAGEDIGKISKALGHSSIATTCRYLDHISPQSVIDMMKARK